ncbi:hypothetical protein SESBI_15978 [Sesbania bispinosa]|nr:hypothetical protein SESBI_15978 [Sesbania bispinosa]
MSVTKLPNGVQTTMCVEMVAPNHLRFVENPKPSDLVGDGRRPLSDQRGETSINFASMDECSDDEEANEDSEMVNDTYNKGQGN